MSAINVEVGDDVPAGRPPITRHRYALPLYGLAAIITLVVVGRLLLGASGHPFAFDRSIHGWFLDHRSARLTTFMNVVSDAASSVTVVPIAVGVLIIGIVRHRMRDFAFFLLATLGGQLVSYSIKVSIDRPRPPLLDRLVSIQDPSWPSGHSVQVVVCYGGLAVLAHRWSNGRIPKGVLAALAVLAALLVGSSRLYLGVHWPSDVATGWLLGAAWLSVAWALVLKVPAAQSSKTAAAQTPETAH